MFKYIVLLKLINERWELKHWLRPLSPVAKLEKFSLHITISYLYVLHYAIIVDGTIFGCILNIYLSYDRGQCINWLATLLLGVQMCQNLLMYRNRLVFQSM